MKNVWKNYNLSIVLLSLYVWTWAKATLENRQSEFLQLFCMVVFTAFLIHKGSAESKDSNDRMEQLLHRIERRLAALEKP